MAPGTVGTDVQQLEAGLLRYGFDPGPIDGVYDQQTEAAVAWYQSAGYSPFGPTDEQLAASSTAQGDHFTAQTDLLTAKENLATAQGQLATAQQQAAGRGWPRPGRPPPRLRPRRPFSRTRPRRRPT
jgi:peptidoglycan hydrolase-like protein with peptidoglycan-binding domain